MTALLETFVKKPFAAILALIAVVVAGWRFFPGLPVDVFPDIAVPRVVVQTEVPGLAAEEVEQRVTIPIESVMNGIPGISTIRSSSSGGLSFVWVEFDWRTDLDRARFDVFERLERVRDLLPEEADAEIAPTVSVTGEIMLIALVPSEKDGATLLDLREIAEYELRPRLLSERGIGEVVVLGGRLPEYRVSVSPRRLAEYGLSIPDVVDAVRDTRTYASGGYLASYRGDEIPLRQIARADSLDTLRRSSVVRGDTGMLRLGDVADVSLSGAPRRGSASFEGREAVIVSVQKAPGGNTLEITKRLDKAIESFRPYAKSKGIVLDANAYRQADFIDASVAGGAKVARDAAAVVLVVLVLTLFRVRTIAVVLASMAITIPVSLAVFPVLGLGINVMTLGGFAVAAGDIVDAAIIFAEVVWRRKDVSIVEAMKSVAPGVAFSTLTVAVVFVPLLMLSGLEGAFFRPLALSYLAVFLTSLAVAFVMVPALSRILGRDRGSASAAAKPAADSFGIKLMKAIYRPFLFVAVKFPKTVMLLAFAACLLAAGVATRFGSGFLPPFHEDSFNVVLSLPPGASLDETERVAESCVEGIRAIEGVKSVVRRTGRAERDQHAEPVSSSEYVVRVDMDGDVEGVRRSIRELLGGIPGCSSLVGYPIAHRISAVLSGTEAELAVNVYGEDIGALRSAVAKMKSRLDEMDEVSDVRANREVTVRTLKIDYDLDALAEAGLTLREAGEQVSAAFNGVEAGEVRDGLKIRSVVVRIEGFDEGLKPSDLASFILVSRNGRRVRLDDVARIRPEDASDLMLREGGRRKALVSLNPAEGVDSGSLVEKLKKVLDPVAEAEGMSVEYGGSHQARESAAKRLGILSVALAVAIFMLLACALKSSLAALIALINVPLALVGGVAAVWLAEPVLSVSSLVGFVTVTGFVLRNGILLLQRYRELADAGEDAESAIRTGSLERMAPIFMTSLTTVLGLVPIILAGEKPGGELLSPLAVVQFGGIAGALVLNLAVLPAAAMLAAKGFCWKVPAKRGAAILLLASISVVFAGCRTYEAKPVEWEKERVLWMEKGVLKFETLEDVAKVAVVGNSGLNKLRIESATAENVARESGWWEDPELDVDLMRIVNPSDNPWLGGASLSFSVPLSDALGLEKKAAFAYSRAAADEIIAAENEVASNAKMAAIRYLYLKETVRTLAVFDEDERMKNAFAAAETLAEAGELATTEVAAAKRRRHERIHRLRQARDGADEAESELRKLLGVSPNTELVFASNPAESCPHDCMPPERKALSYVQHPRVRAALHRFDGGEAALEAEISRQYPDLKFGPAYSREEGLDRFGIVGGISLPLWNRNRKAIAEAEGKRDASRADALALWKEIVEDVSAARKKLRRLLEHRAENAAKSVQEVNALSDAGEIDALGFIAAREEILEARLSELEWKTDICLVSEEIEKNNVRR